MEDVISDQGKALQLGLYKHYKGLMYEVTSVALHSETLEELVVYRALYGKYGLWVRPLKMFCENVVIDGVSRPRFEYIGRPGFVSPG
jgi:hypothetical protein